MVLYRKLAQTIVWISLVVVGFVACGNTAEIAPVAESTTTLEPTAVPTQTPLPEPTATLAPDPTAVPIIPLVETAGMATTGLRSFMNDEVALRLNHPTDWVVSENVYQGSGLFTFGTEGGLTLDIDMLADNSTALIIAGDVDSMGLDVSVSVLEPEPLLDAYLLMTTQNVSSQSFATLLPTHNILVNEQTGATTQFSMQNGNGDTFIGQAATVIHEDRALFFYAISPEKIADADTQLINAMLYSIELTPTVQEVLAVEQESIAPQTAFPISEVAELMVDGTEEQLLNLATTDEPIAIISRPQDSWLDLQLAIRDTQNDTVLQVDSTFAGEPEAVVLMPDVNEQYRLSVQEFYGEQGNVSLIVEPLNSMTVLTEGVAVTDQTDPIRHEFTAVAGQLYLLTAEPVDGETDLIIGLSKEDGTFTSRDNSEAGQVEFMLFGVDVEGLYEVVVSERSAAVAEYRMRVVNVGTSNYVLAVDETRVPPVADNASELNFGSAETGELAVGETADFQFTYTLDQDVLFIASGLAGEDLAVDVYNEAGNTIITVDDTGNDTAETFLFPTVSEAGTYFIRVRNYDSALATTFQLEAVDATDWRINYEAQGVVEDLASDTKATYELSLTPADILYVRVEPETNEDIQISISAPDETPVTLTDDSGTGDFETLLFRPSVAGDYTVSVFDYYGKAGGFTIDIGFLNEQ